MFFRLNRLILTLEIIASFMEKKETKPINVTEYQQKLIDIFFKDWKTIIGAIAAIVVASFYVGVFYEKVSNNKNENESNLEHQKEMEAVRAELNKNCDKMISHYTEIIKSITPNNSKK